MTGATTNPFRLARLGLDRARHHLPLALLLWGAHLALAALAVAPFAAGFARLLGDRPAAAGLLGRPSLDLLVQVLRAGGELFGTLPVTLLVAALLALLLNALLAGGVLEVLLTADDRPLLHRFARGAGHFAGRMLRIGAFAAPSALVLVVLAALPFFGAAKRLAENDREIAAAGLRLGGVATIGLVLLLVLLALDLARIRLVRDGRRDTFRALRTSFWLVLRHPFRIVGTWLVLALALALLLALYALVARLVPTTATLGILVLALAQQLLLVARAALRVALWGAEIEIVRGLVPPPAAARVEPAAFEPLRLETEPAAPPPIPESDGPIAGLGGAPGGTTLDTPRLRLRELTADDAAFVLRLVNEPAFVANIGEKNLHTLDDARRFIATGPWRCPGRPGYGQLAVEWRALGDTVGICGLLYRETLDVTDVGFAFLSEYRGRGFATEAAEAVLRHGYETLGLREIVGLTTRENVASVRVLEKLGMRYSRTVALAAGKPEIDLYAPLEVRS